MTRSDTAAYPPRGMSRDEAARYNLADGEFWTTPPLRYSVGLIRRSVIVFLRTMWSLASRRTKRISGFKKIRLVPLKDFFDSIGQTETNRRVHVTSGFTPIPDINLARCNGGHRSRFHFE